MHDIPRDGHQPLQVRSCHIEFRRIAFQSTYDDVRARERYDMDNMRGVRWIRGVNIRRVEAR